MNNQPFQFPDDIFNQMKCLRKISPNDKFPCFSCFDDRTQKLACKVCFGSGFVYGSHPMVQFSQDFIEKKINYLKQQEQCRKNQLMSENESGKSDSVSYKIDRDSSMEEETINKNIQNKQMKNVSIELKHNMYHYDNQEVSHSKMLSSSNSDEEDQTIKHHGFCCDSCSQDPILGYRYHCQICDDYDLCSKCYKKNIHNHDFVIFKQTQGALRSSIHPKHDNLLKNVRKSIRKID